MKKELVIIGVAIGMIVGCSQKAVTKSDIQGNLASKQEQKHERTEQKQTGMIPAVPVESIDSKDNASIKTTVQDNMFADLLFDYDKYDVRDSFKPILRKVSDFMSKHPEARLSIEGYCDERGTNEYNLALGDRRAKAIKDYMVSMGVASKRIDTISYGEERSSCQESTEACWTKNRRAHFVVLGSSSM